MEQRPAAALGMPRARGHGEDFPRSWRADVEREGTAGPAFLQLRAEGKERPGEGKLYLLCILLRAQAETFWLFFGLKNKGTEVPTPRVFLMFYFLNYLLIYLFLACWVSVAAPALSSPCGFVGLLICRAPAPGCLSSGSPALEHRLGTCDARA